MYKVIILIFLLSNIACNISNHITTANEARELQFYSMIKSRKIFLNKLLIKIIPDYAKSGKTGIWLLANEFWLNPLNSDDAKILINYGYKVEMCTDSDRIAYVSWE